MTFNSEEGKKKIAVEYFQRAYEAQRAGDFAEAVKLYNRSIETCPTAEAYTFLGWTYSSQGNYEKAIQYCRTAIEIDPEFGNPYNDIGAYLIEKGSFDEAIPWLEKATIAPRYDSYCYPHYNLGRIYESKGMMFRAQEEYQKSLQANPDYLLAQEALQKLSFTIQ